MTLYSNANHISSKGQVYVLAFKAKRGPPHSGADRARRAELARLMKRLGAPRPEAGRLRSTPAGRDGPAVRSGHAEELSEGAPQPRGGPKSQLQRAVSVAYRVDIIHIIIIA